MPTKNQILQYGKHLLIVMGLGALSLGMNMLLQSLGAFNVSNLPVQYQTLATLILPSVVLAFQNLKNQIDKEEAQAEAAKAVEQMKNMKQ